MLQKARIFKASFYLIWLDVCCIIGCIKNSNYVNYVNNVYNDFANKLCSNLINETNFKETAQKKLFAVNIAVLKNLETCKFSGKLFTK